MSYVTPSLGLGIRLVKLVLFEDGCGETREERLTVPCSDTVRNTTLLVHYTSVVVEVLS
jgi:hypothetical protein